MSHFFTDIISIFDFKEIDTGKKGLSDSPIVADLEACIQPGGTDVMVLSMANINAAKSFVIFINNTDVKIENGYKIIDQNGKKYIVKGSPEIWNNNSIKLKHQKIAVESEN